MKRKVIQIANSTQLISLPRKWAQRYNVRKGDELEVEEKGERVVVSSESAPQLKEIHIDMSGLAPYLAERLMSSSYMKGYDTITITYDDVDIAIAIQNKITELIGFEILTQTRDTITVSSISTSLNLEFEPSLRRAFLITLDMGESAMNALKNNDSKALNAVMHTDQELNKFCFFCMRSIRKGHQGDFGNYILYYLIKTLEDIGDEYKLMSPSLLKIRKGQRKFVIKIMRDLNHLMKRGYEFFYKPEKSQAVDAIMLYRSIRKEVRRMLATDNTDEAFVLSSLDTIARFIYHFFSMRLDTLDTLHTADNEQKSIRGQNV